jgi:hypothetical protein
MATRPPQVRPKAPRFLLVVFSAFALVGLTHCNMTADKVTGVAVTMGDDKEKQENHGNCISDCAHKANDALDDEKDLHKSNLKNCNGDPTCISAENARHDAAVDKIQSDKKSCMDGCHHQGGGHGGGGDDD